MTKKAKPTPSRTCADCFHFFACHLWVVSISTNVAPQCPQFEPARYASLADLHEMHQMAKGELVPVVRCRECKESEQLSVLDNDCLYCGVWDTAVHCNGYCYHGAKMDGGSE